MKEYQMVMETTLRGMRLLLAIVAFYSTLFVANPPSARAATTEALNCSSSYQIVQTLGNGAKWEMCWEPRAGYGYLLSQVIYTPPNDTRRKVLEKMHVAQLLVPYDDNQVRYRDISYGVNMRTLAAAECPNGTLLTNSTVCMVRRQNGLAFKNPLTGAGAQSEAVTLFGYYGVGAYYYIFQYSFFDDGSIEPAVGASGSLQRFGGTAATGWPVKSQIGINHNHLVYWRMDFDVDGKSNNVVEQIEFSGSGTSGRTMSITPLTTEAAAKNDLARGRFWRVRNSAQANVNGRSVSYEIEPSVADQLRLGSEPFTQNDFYVTQFNASENLVDDGQGLQSFANGQTLTDPVLWYGVNFHHVPRDEDDVRMPAHWQGFKIRPRDVVATATGQANRVPVVTAPGAQTSAVGATVALSITATDPDGDALSFSATGLPAGLSINSGTGRIAGTPTTAGASTVVVTVADTRGGSATTTFGWTITQQAPTNRPPVITAPGAQSGTVGTAVNLAINASDPDGDTLSYSASGLPAGLSINAGSGVISGTPTTAGSSTVTVSVNDGRGGNPSVSFGWTVSSGSSGGGATQTFGSTGTLSIPNSGASSPYPLSVNVSGMTGTVSGLTVELRGLSHTYPADLDVLLVGPGGQKLLLMSDAGGGTDVNGVTLTFTATGAVLPGTALTTGSYRPGNFGTSDSFAGPAPAGPYGTDLAVFNGSNPNGSWQLYVMDDAGGDLGSLSAFAVTVTTGGGTTPANRAPNIGSPGAQSGTVGTAVNLAINASDPDGDTLSYSASGLPAGLSINAGSGVISGTPTTAGSSTVTVSVNDGRGGNPSVSFGWTVSSGSSGGGATQTFGSTGTLSIPNSGASSPYPLSVNVSGMTGTVSGLTVELRGLSHTYPADLDVLLVGPGGQKLLLMSDAGGGTDVNGVTLTFTATGAVLPGTALTTGSYRPGNFGTSDSFAGPAPAGPYGTDLAVFNGSNPNGSWQLYVMDDAGGDLGSLSAFAVTVTSR